MISCDDFMVFSIPDSHFTGYAFLSCFQNVFGLWFNWFSSKVLRMKLDFALLIVFVTSFRAFFYFVQEFSLFSDLAFRRQWSRCFISLRISLFSQGVCFPRICFSISGECLLIMSFSACLKMFHQAILKLSVTNNCSQFTRRRSFLNSSLLYLLKSQTKTFCGRNLPTCCLWIAPNRLWSLRELFVTILQSIFEISDVAIMSIKVEVLKLFLLVDRVFVPNYGTI